MSADTREAMLEQLVVAAMDSGGASQSQAVDALWQHLRSWAPRWLLCTTSWPAWLPTAERGDIVRDACSYLVLKCSSRDTRAHGVTRDPSAWAFKVLRNYVHGQLRRSRRRHDRAAASAEDAAGVDGDFAPDSELAEALILLEAEILTMARPRFAANVRQMFHCYAAHRLGTCSEPVNTSPRQRELLYLHRHRGKAAALKAYARLQAKGLDPKLDFALRAMLGSRDG